MGEAILSGLLSRGVAGAGDIWAADVSPARREYLTQRYGIQATEDNLRAAEEGEVAILAIKPQNLAEVMAGLSGHLATRQLVISIVAGATISTLTAGLNHSTVVRVMPNTPAQIGEGISVWMATPQVTPQQKEATQAILASLGKSIYVAEEKYIDMATSLSASGPGFIFLIIEAMIDAGVHMGMARDMAQELVLQTMLGSTRLAIQFGKHPAELKNMVTSPGGTTAEGLLILEEGGVRALLTQAYIAAYEKTKLLGGGK